MADEYKLTIRGAEVLDIVVDDIKSLPNEINSTLFTARVIYHVGVAICNELAAIRHAIEERKT